MGGGGCVRGGRMGVCGWGGGHVWWGECVAGGMHGRGMGVAGAYIAGDVCGRGACMAGAACVAGRGHAWHMVNERVVYILLECILVRNEFFWCTCEGMETFVLQPQDTLPLFLLFKDGSKNLSHMLTLHGRLCLKFQFSHVKGK